MKRIVTKDGTFFVSLIKTREGENIAFAYAWESATEELAHRITRKFPQYFVVENNQDLWLKADIDGVVSKQELISAASLDDTDSIVLVDVKTNEVLVGTKDWLNLKEQSL